MSSDATAGESDLESRLSALVKLLEPAGEVEPGQERVSLSPGYDAPATTCGRLLTVARLCVKGAQDSDKSGGLIGRLMTSRSARRRQYLRNGAAAGALLLEGALDRLGYSPIENPPTTSREEGQAMLNLLKPLLKPHGVPTPAALRLGARVIRHPHSPWGGREYDVYLTREDLEANLAFSITGPRGRTVALDKGDAPELVLRDAGDVAVETSGPLQFDVVTASEGINLLYHDSQTLEQLRHGETPDAVGQATFGHARLARGQAAFRMTQLSGHTLEQPLIPHLIRIHYQATDGVWSR